MPARRYLREELLAAAVGFSHPQTVRFQDVDAAGLLDRESDHIVDIDFLRHVAGHADVPVAER